MRKDIDLHFFRGALLRRMEAIKKSCTEKIESVELDQTKVGRLSRMDAIQQKEMAEAARRLSSIELRRIEVALERIKSGDYGYCIICDEDISEGRLKVDPSTLICINCAKAAEE